MNVKELWMKTDTEVSNPPALEWAEKFAALVEAEVEGKWKRAVIDELMTCHIYTAAHENDPRKALQDLISWNAQVALDPLVSSDAKALIGYVTALEREECAKVCDDLHYTWRWDDEPDSSSGPRECAAAIRTRGMK